MSLLLQPSLTLGPSSFLDFLNWAKGTLDPPGGLSGDGCFFKSCQMCPVTVSKVLLL